MANDPRHDRLRRDAEEDFKKDFPTRDPNPEDVLFLQGYEGEMLRELVTEDMDSEKDVGNLLSPFRAKK